MASHIAPLKQDSTSLANQVVFLLKLSDLQKKKKISLKLFTVNNFIIYLIWSKKTWT